jgi:hypothetical protein
MATFNVNIYYNEGEGKFIGYQPGDRLRFVRALQVQANDKNGAMNKAYAMMQSDAEAMGIPAALPPGERSMSVGDVIEFSDGERYSVADTGWRRVASKKHGTNYTFDGTPIEDGFRVVTNDGDEEPNPMFLDEPEVEEPWYFAASKARTGSSNRTHHIAKKTADEAPPFYGVWKELVDKLPPLYSQENNPDPDVPVRFIHPFNTWEWYPYEFDGKDTLFGLVHGWVDELGYFTVSELVGVGAMLDEYWVPAKLSEVKRMLEAREQEQQM